VSDLSVNVEKLGGYLKQFREHGVFNHINGQVVPAISGETFENFSPVDESGICQIAKSSAADIDAAAIAAAHAFPAWRDMSVEHC
jgi:5-carboxymethyl-2-hydroxymuconic-semialdehyde dehydrogenase